MSKISVEELRRLSDDRTGNPQLIARVKELWEQTQKETGQQGKLLKSGTESLLGFCFTTKFACLCCGSHSIAEGSIVEKPAKYEESAAIGGKWQVEREKSVTYYQCRDCERILYCRKN